MADELISLVLRMKDADVAGRYDLSLHPAFVADDKGLASTPVQWDLKHPVSKAARSPRELQKLIFEEKTNEAVLNSIGVQFFELLFPDPIRKKQAEVAGGKGVCIYLDIRSDALRFLPWELLLDEGHLAFDQNFRLLRYTAEAARIERPPEWPLRILIVTGANPGSAAVDAAPEVEAIEDAVWGAKHCVHLEHCAVKTLDLFEKTLEEVQPHILHFIGHGAIDNVTKVPGLVLFPGLVWTAAKVRTFFASRTRSWRPRLVVLNACRSAAEGSPEEEDEKRSWSMESAFLGLGVPAVIAMQGNLRPEAGRRFSDEFYKSVIAGKSVDEALVQGRNEIRRANLNDKRQAFLPRLHCALSPAKVLAFAPVELTPKITNSKSFAEVPLFVDRETMRRELLGAYFPTKKKATRLYLVHGDAQSGKKWAVNWALYALASQQHEVRWIDVVGDGPVDWLNLLRIIRDNDPAGYPRCVARQPLPKAQLRQFNWDLRQCLLDPAREPALMPADLPADFAESGKDSAPKELGDTAMSFLLGSFVDALAEIVKERPLTLVLARLKEGRAALELTSFEYFCKGVLARLGDGPLKNLTVIVILPPNAPGYREKFATFKNLEWYREVEFTSLPAEDFSRVTREYLRRRATRWNDPEVQDYLEDFIQKTVKKLGDNKWPIARLQKLGDVYAAFEGLATGS